ncbi:MAG: hypothetical protein IJG23_05090 [Clostridia bacterium]|nr:hypothetical protein [Clostridia bacterium]
MATKKTTKKAEEPKKTAQLPLTETEKKVEKAPAAKKTEKKVEKKAEKKAAPAKKAAKAEKKVEKKVEKKAEKKAEKKPAKKAAKKPAKKAAKKEEKALIASTVKGLFFEFGEKQVDASALADLAKAAFKENGGKGSIRTMQLYVKAEDNALYYVINGKESGKVEL